MYIAVKPTPLLVKLACSPSSAPKEVSLIKANLRLKSSVLLLI